MSLQNKLILLVNKNDSLKSKIESAGGKVVKAADLMVVGPKDVDVARLTLLDFKAKYMSDCPVGKVFNPKTGKCIKGVAKAASPASAASKASPGEHERDVVAYNKWIKAKIAKLRKQHPEFTEWDLMNEATKAAATEYAKGKGKGKKGK